MAIYILAWFAVIMPLLGAGATFLAESPRRGAYAALGFTALSFVLAAIVLGVRMRTATQAPYESLIAFFSMSPPESTQFASRFQPELGVHVDSLSAVFGVLIAFIGTVTQAYAGHALRGDPSYRRFFWAASLLTFAVLGIVYAPNLFQFLLLAGIGSVAIYLLTTHWWQRPDAAAPARRILVTLSIADITLLLATVFLFVKFGLYAVSQPAPSGQDIFDPFSFTNLAQLVQAAQHGVVAGAGLRTVEVLSIVVFFAALIRAAQVPFHVWFSELTNAPAAVIAITASTAGVAGTYLLARIYPLLLAAPHLLAATALVGAVSAALFAIIGLAQRDLLRIGALVAGALLGLSFAALGTGGFGAGLFILLVSGLATALFFLGAGNVVRVYRTRNIHETGGAWPRMQVTSAALIVWAVAVGGLALTGYYALSSAFANQPPGGGRLSGATQALTAALLIVTTAVLTLVAMRVVFTVCAGKPVQRRGFQAERVTEVEPRMRRWVSVSILALVAAVLFGLPGIGATKSGLGPTFTNFVAFGSHVKPLPVDGTALLISLLLFALATAASSVLYAPARRAQVSAVVERFEPAVRVLARGFFVERLSHRMSRPFLIAARLIARFDDTVGERFADSASQAVLLAGDLVARLRSSRLNAYLAGGVAVAGVLVVLSVLAATGHLGGATL